MSLTHFNEAGEAVTVDVSKKENTKRIAVAKGCISMNDVAMAHLKSGTAKKGDVLGVARVAGMMAVKKTSDLIPMCHPLLITKIVIAFEILNESTVEVACTVGCVGKTGVEMEAMTGASVCLLTIYDMLKAVDRGMVISDIRLMEKLGGKSGHYERA